MSETGENNEPTRFIAWATICLIGFNVIAFAGQLAAARYAPDFPLDDYFALSLDGVRHHYYWQLLTFQFMHGGFLHLALISFFAVFSVVGIFYPSLEPQVPVPPKTPLNITPVGD